MGGRFGKKCDEEKTLIIEWNIQKTVASNTLYLKRKYIGIIKIIMVTNS